MPVLSKKQEQKIERYFYCVAAGSDPCGWRKPIQDTWNKYKGSRKAEAMARRYSFKEDCPVVCKKMHITYNTFYNWRMEFLISAAMAGIRSGLDI